MRIGMIMMKSNNTFRSRAAAPFLRGTVALALVAALALAAAGAEEFRILGAVDAVRGDGIATVIFPERAGRGAYLIIEDGRAIGEVRIIDLPCYRNGRFGFYRCMAEYAIGEKKWTTKQIIDFEPERLYSVMRLASEKYGDDQFKKMMSSVPKAAKFDPRAPLRN